MKFSAEKKHSIRMYLLEKIAQGTKGVSKSVSETFSISSNTVHSYLKELQNEDIIRKTKRDEYELVAQKYYYHLERSKGHLDSDTYAYDAHLLPLLRPFADNVQRIWSYAFSEMVNNVMDHSGAENLSLFIAQTYLSTSVLIVDDGVGIFEKIKEHFSLSSLDEAVCELFKGKLTTDVAHHSGEGIFFTSKMMDSFLIYSGGKIFAATKYEDTLHLDIKNPNFQGTCVSMSLSNFSRREPSEIFDAYADDEGGFTKTSIPLKSIFDTAPVSRSQAKRVASRLEHFKEVILDFEGLDWMGQGFAHELFVVYAQTHPETRLTAINMNDAVAQMYRHVTGNK